jgi:hypothetical protein
MIMPNFLQPVNMLTLDEVLQQDVTQHVDDDIDIIGSKAEVMDIDFPDQSSSSAAATSQSIPSLAPTIPIPQSNEDELTETEVEDDDPVLDAAHARAIAQADTVRSAVLSTADTDSGVANMEVDQSDDDGIFVDRSVQPQPRRRHIVEDDE